MPEPALPASATLRAALHWAEALLDDAGACFAQGTDNARDEAAWLVLHALGEPVDAPISNLQRRLSPRERQAVAALLRERLAGRPAAYLTGRTWFCGLEFLVDERVIVPRSPIAELIQARFEPWCDPPAVRRVLDLCTGSGCIAIACAMAFPRAQVYASDLSAPALAVARHNVALHGLAQRVHLCQSDLFAELAGNGPFDLIVSNPPYVPSRVVDAMPAELRAEPRMALDGGRAGMDLVARILHQAVSYLDDTGVLVVEVGDFRDELQRAFPGDLFTWPRLSNGGSGVFVSTAAELARAFPRT